MSAPDSPDGDARRLAHEGAHVDFSTEVNYGGYLHLDQILSAQQPRSRRHDEMLFIIQHQTTELWMKLILHELGAARERVRADDLQPAFKMLARVGRIMGQLIQAWDVLSTLTPSEYTAFRGDLGRASGFQSYQFRLIEFLLGHKDAAKIDPHRHRPELAQMLEAALATPSIYDEAIRVLAHRGFAIAPAVLGRDVRRPYAADPSVHAAWMEAYRDPEHHWDLYELAEELVDLEDVFRQWRFRHVTTVERIIGFKPGTGGTAGVAYLRTLLDVRLFPELWDLRTDL